MRGLARTLVTAGAAVLLTVSLAACTAGVSGPSPAADPATEPRVVIAPLGNAAPLPEAAPDEPTAAFSGLQARIDRATAAAAAAGANLTMVLLDRNTGQRLSNGNRREIVIASVVKLFIADDLLMRDEKLSPQDWQALAAMLRSSDDSPAEIFWNRGGGRDIVTRVAERYGLRNTRPPRNGRWFNTVSTASDLVRYLDMLLSGAGGLPREKAELIITNLAQSTPLGIDGTQPGGVYPQRFGLPDGLPAEPVAVKQGWMCCVGGAWTHLSVGLIGADRRYVMAIGSDQRGSADATRNTLTEAVRTMFPGGRI
ncbi:MAG: serine hydrolase [Mycolicibacterium hassiacum]|jgi:hypothetical protein|nr:MAG: hypothetical protein DIU75_01755 [Mycolicibacterium hassiacum]